MIALIIGLVVSLIVIFAGTSILIRVAEKMHYGQYIRQDGPGRFSSVSNAYTHNGRHCDHPVCSPGLLHRALYRFAAFGPGSVPALLVLFAMLSMGFSVY